jgi:hypothetical protein
MRMKDLTPKQLSSVSCPTCGVGVGERCLLHSGGPRSEPHVDRKLAAAEATENKRFRRSQSLAKRVPAS